MTHYICTGECKAVSESAEAICETATCSRHGMKLEECSCEDGRHGRVPPEGMEEMPTTDETSTM